MDKIVTQIRKRQEFHEETKKTREREACTRAQEGLPPVFNKRLFSARRGVIITREAKNIMDRNKEDHELSRNELAVMRTVVDGLRMIHKDLPHVKKALAHTVTLEPYSQFEYVIKQPHEEMLSCYYILQGSVEVTYDYSFRGSMQVYEPHIIYNHVTGEYLGLVAAEGAHGDIAPPATVYTKEDCQFLRIDRQRFHELVETYSTALEAEKRHFLDSGNSVLSHLPNNVQEKLVTALIKQEYTPNKVIMKQGKNSEHLYFILSGHCMGWRQVYIPRLGRECLFAVRNMEPGDVFCEECVLEGQPSLCTVVTLSSTICFQLSRTDVAILGKEQVTRVLRERRFAYPCDARLAGLGCSWRAWQLYKQDQLHRCLGTGDHTTSLDGLLRDMAEQDPSAQHRKKLLDFMAGPLAGRAKTATWRHRETGSQADHVTRAHSAAPSVSSRKVVATTQEASRHDKKTRHVTIEVTSTGGTTEEEKDRNRSLPGDKLEHGLIEEGKNPNESEDQEEKAEEQESNLKSGLYDEKLTASAQIAFDKYRLEVLRRRMNKQRDKASKELTERVRQMTQATKAKQAYRERSRHMRGSPDFMEMHKRSPGEFIWSDIDEEGKKSPPKEKWTKRRKSMLDKLSSILIISDGRLSSSKAEPRRQSFPVTRGRESRVSSSSLGTSNVEARKAFDSAPGVSYTSKGPSLRKMSSKYTHQ